MYIRGKLHLTSDTTKWLVLCPKCTVYDSVVLRCNNGISIRHPLLNISNIISGWIIIVLVNLILHLIKLMRKVNYGQVLLLCSKTSDLVTWQWSLKNMASILISSHLGNHFSNIISDWIVCFWSVWYSIQNYW